MKTSLERSRQAARLLIQAPSIGLASLAYSIATHLASFRADLLDVADPWWVVTIGLVILLSPILHMVVIGKVDAIRRGETFSLRALPLEGFADLVLGELLVNGLVVLGSAFFLLPGIYVGLRSVYYKQSIILHKARPAEAIRESFRMTASPRAVLRILLLLAVPYSFLLAILVPMTQGWWIHPVGILVSTSFIAWVNVYITLSFGDSVANDVGSQRTEKIP